MVIPAAALVLLLMLQLSSSTDAQAGGGTGPAPGCPSPATCGDVTVPYPFVIGAGCYLPAFDLTCDRTRSPPRLLFGGGGTLEVLEISASTPRCAPWTPPALGQRHLARRRLRQGQHVCPVREAQPVRRHRLQRAGHAARGQQQRHHRLLLLLHHGDTDMWTNPVVSDPGDGTATCSGIGCCQTPIPIGRPSYAVQFKILDVEYTDKLAMTVRIAERGWFDGVATQMLNESATDSASRTPVPVVLEWAVASTPIPPPGTGAADAAGNSSCPIDAAKSACRSSHSTCHNVTNNYRTGYVCQCEKGYAGNPYLAGDGGCQDIDECALPGKCLGACTNTPGDYVCLCPRGARGNPFMTKTNGCMKSSLGLSIGIGVGSGAGLLVLALGAAFVIRRIKHQRARMLKQKFFKQNRGHLLKQLVSQNADIAERMIVPLAELEKATNNFDKDRELGGGGHGTLSDQHVGDQKIKGGSPERDRRVHK
ncbi:unnamed protein product [Urochloa humidicola]